jgi:pyrroloquinoline quinone biosynthesis protein E
VKYVGAERPRQFPIRIQVEATTKCNLRCPSCSHSREQADGRHLGEADLCRILDRLPRVPARVVLSGIGEPLVNPQFFSLVDVLARRRIKCEFYTNGTLLGKKLRQAILARDNIDSISISCDGAAKETFEGLRLGADFDRWKQFVGAFLAEARNQRGDKLRLGANIVVTRRNLHEVEAIIRLAADLGFDGLGIIEPVPVDDTAAALCPSPTEFPAPRQRELVELATGLGLRTFCFCRRDNVPPKALPRCLEPWQYIFVRVNGDVAPCFALFGSDRGAVMGNIYQQEFDEIWRGERFRAFREAAASGTNLLCRVCPYY